MRETNNRGVDVVLNSLSGELLHASVSFNPSLMGFGGVPRTTSDIVRLRAYSTPLLPSTVARRANQRTHWRLPIVQVEFAGIARRRFYALGRRSRIPPYF